VLELLRPRACVVICAASPAAVDSCADVAGIAGALAARVADDEVMLVAPPSSAAEVLAAANDRAAAVDDDALVLDVTDGWATWTLRGDQAARAFSHLSRLGLPDRGWVQGEVAGVAARVAVTDSGIHVFVPSMVGDHVHAVIARRCATLAPIDTGREDDWRGDHPSDGAQGAGREASG
jgi:hypothetical protein